MKLRLVAIFLSTVGALHCQTSSPSPPDASERQKVLTDATKYAFNHETNLPNFVCTQTTRRFEDFNNGGWRLIDLIVRRLTYFEGRAVYELMLLNGQPASTSHDQLRGASPSGHFDSVMRAIFLPQTQTDFTWQESYTLRGKRMDVYGYHVRAFKSSYHIEISEESLDLVTAYHGLIFIDSENHFVHRITLYADEIPVSFPIQDVSLALDYGYTQIGDRNYLLPLQIEFRSREGARVIRNDVNYDNYRTFSAVPVSTLRSEEAIRK
jgi:hypothetical protein